MNNMRITKPALDSEELEAVAEVLKSGFLTQGPRATEFGSLVADWVGAEHGIPTSSCTTALQLALEAVGVVPGDEVVVPDFTFPATANAVIQQGAIPVVADIDPRTFTMTPESLEHLITAKTKAVIPVHAFGLCADMGALNRIAESREIPVIEDAACALGASYMGVMAGNLAQVACFSFHPRKILTTGEGGMITTSDRALFEKISLLSSHGGRRGELFLDFEEPGYNYRLSDINAAIGIVQMGKLEHLLAERRRLAGCYATAFRDNHSIECPIEPPGYVHTFQSYVVLLNKEVSRNEVIRRLGVRGIETTIGTYALHQQAYFQDNFKSGENVPQISGEIADRALTLPLYPGLEDTDIDRVAGELQHVIETC